MKIRQNVMALIFNNNKELLLVEQIVKNKENKKINKYWYLPKGGVEEKNLEKSLKRELEEELSLQNYEIIGKSKYKIFYKLKQKDRGFDAKENTIFVLKVNNPKIAVNKDEINDYKFVKIKHIDKYINNKETLETIKKILKEFKIT